MMRKSTRLQRLYNRFAASTRGVAAIEFAMILPVLATLFLATFDGGRAHRHLHESARGDLLAGCHHQSILDDRVRRT